MSKLFELFKVGVLPSYGKGAINMSISWNDPSCKISKYFTVKEACWLPSWSKLYSPSDEEKANILKMAIVMDEIRNLIGLPINTHCWIRPTSYNAAIGGAAHSMHLSGLAVDFDCGENCDITRTKLIPLMKTLGIRIEDKPGSNWVHVDIKPVTSETQRFFKP